MKPLFEVIRPYFKREDTETPPEKVSPYNLFQVRFLRYLTIGFLLLNTIWWTLLLISIFVSPPGLHTRGSGFFDLAFVTLTAGILIVTLLFFAEPAQALRISSAVLALILLIDMLIIVSVSRLRWEESAVGITSVIWAFLMALWNIVTDRVVSTAKHDEEVRLTGRPETRRTLREWLEVFSAAILLSFFSVIAFLFTCTLILRAREATLKAPGSIYPVDGGTYHVHLACFGNASSTWPTLLLEGGESPLEATLVPWAHNAHKNGSVQRFCYWDRPGYAFSDSAPSPHSAGMSARALSEALAIAGEEGPWIVAGAGYGAIVARIFGSVHARDVVGMVLIDPLPESLLHRVGGSTNGFKLWGYGVLSPLGLWRIPGALFAGQSREDRVFGKAAGSGGKLIKAKLQENLVAESLTRNEIEAARTILGREIPLVVVSSGVEVRRDSEWSRGQQESSKLTDKLVAWTVVNGAPHEVWKTEKGRDAMERGLKKLYKAVKA
jgi:pimeloyl-ACP methyl ester carboxylesterase